MNKICSIALKHGIGHNYQYARVVATAAITMLKEKKMDVKVAMTRFVLI